MRGEKGVVQGVEAGLIGRLGDGRDLTVPYSNLIHIFRFRTVYRSFSIKPHHAREQLA